MQLLGGTRISVTVDGLSWTLWFEHTEYEDKVSLNHTPRYLNLLTYSIGTHVVHVCEFPIFVNRHISAYRHVTFHVEVSLACDLRVKQSTQH